MARFTTAVVDPKRLWGTPLKPNCDGAGCSIFGDGHKTRNTTEPMSVNITISESAVVNAFMSFC